MRSTAGVTGVSSIADALPLGDRVAGTRLSHEPFAGTLLLHCPVVLLSLLLADGAEDDSSTAGLEDISLDNDLAAGAAEAASAAAEAAATSADQPAGVVAPRDA